MTSSMPSRPGPSSPASGRKGRDSFSSSNARRPFITMRESAARIWERTAEWIRLMFGRARRTGEVGSHGCHGSGTQER